MDKEFLKNVYGYSKIKEELHSIREWYLNPNNLGERKRLLPKGILFYGEPGQGKTFIVREYSKTFNRPVFTIEGNGDNPLDEVVKTYEKAGKESGIVFIDEIDRLIQKDEKLTRILMVQLDGFKTGSGVLTLATCNSFCEMPEALLREGRFDRLFQMRTESDEDLEEMIRGFSLDAGLYLKEDEVSELIESFAGYSPSTIRGIFNNAALRFGDHCCFDNIIDTALFLKTGFISSNKDVEISHHTAIHEAGHAIYLYKHSETMKFMRIYFDSDGGYTNSKNISGKDDVKYRIENIQAGLAGLVAEELLLKKHDIGCCRDLELVYEISFRLLNRTCIDGVSHFCCRHGLFDRNSYSEKMNSIFDEKTSRFIQKNYKEVKKILKKEKKDISLVASYLEKNKGINRESFVRLLENPS